MRIGPLFDVARNTHRNGAQQNFDMQYTNDVQNKY